VEAIMSFQPARQDRPEDDVVIEKIDIEEQISGTG
jgi:hypothetical protein